MQRGERLHWFESNEYGWREWPLKSNAVWLLYRAGLLNLRVHQTEVALGRENLPPLRP